MELSRVSDTRLSYYYSLCFQDRIVSGPCKGCMKEENFQFAVRIVKEAGNRGIVLSRGSEIY